jgi:Raf kinase inhibitor-like YbhB/YbcL family protein
VFNLPAQVNALKEGVPAAETVPQASVQEAQPAALKLSDSRQGKNDFGKTGYGGPCPPGGTHRYMFRLYALDAPLELSRSASRADVLSAIKGHIVAEGRLTGKYQRAAKR